MAGNGSSAEQIGGDSHLFAPLGTPSAVSPALAASPLADGQFRVGRDTEAGMRVGGDTWCCGSGSKEGFQGAMDPGWILTLVARFISKGQVAAVTERQEQAQPAVKVPVLLCPPQRRGPHPG